MKKLKSLLLMALALLPASKTLAQTNAQILYDFGNDRKYVTLTLEMFRTNGEAPTSSLTTTSTTTRWTLTVQT